MESRRGVHPDRTAGAGGRLTPVAGRLLLVAAVALSAPACDGGGTELRVDAPLVISLESPNGPEGAAMLELYGMGSARVEASSGSLFERRSGDTTRVIVILETPGSIVLATEGGRERSTPGWRILEVSDPVNELRPSLDGYTLRFEG